MTEQTKPIGETPEKPAPATSGKGTKAAAKKKSAPPADKKAKSASGSRVAVTFALLALLVALGSGGASYYLWQQLQKTDQQLTRHSHSALTELKQQSTTNQQQIQSLQQLNERAISDLSRNQQALEQTLSILRGQLGQKRSGWSIAEVHYLLSIANRSLLLAGDSGTAIAALEMADRSLASQTDPALVPAREQIAIELRALHNIKQPDAENIALQLSALIDSIDQLPMHGPEERSPATTLYRPDGSGDGTLQAAGRTMWEALKSLVTIRHDVESIQPLMAPDQRLFLRQNLQLKLESARLALLQRNGNLYRTSLEESTAWIKRYFDSHQTSVSSTLETLQHLAAIDIAPKLPDVSGSLLLIRELGNYLPQTSSETTP